LCGGSKRRRFLQGSGCAGTRRSTSSSGTKAKAFVRPLPTTAYIYQDRLGTNIGKALTKREAFSRRCDQSEYGQQVVIYMRDEAGVESAVGARLPDGGAWTASRTVDYHVSYRPVSKNAVFLLSHLYIKTNILPRQARDKHSESSKKRPFFLRATPASIRTGATFRYVRCTRTCSGQC
jgi:hypothetical protein